MDDDNSEYVERLREEIRSKEDMILFLNEDTVDWALDDLATSRTVKSAYISLPESLDDNTVQSLRSVMGQNDTIEQLTLSAFVDDPGENVYPGTCMEEVVRALCANTTMYDLY